MVELEKQIGGDKIGDLVVVVFFVNMKELNLIGGDYHKVVSGKHRHKVSRQILILEQVYYIFSIC